MPRRSGSAATPACAHWVFGICSIHASLVRIGVSTAPRTLNSSNVIIPLPSLSTRSNTAAHATAHTRQCAPLPPRAHTPRSHTSTVLIVSGIPHHAVAAGGRQTQHPRKLVPRDATGAVRVEHIETYYGAARRALVTPSVPNAREAWAGPYPSSRLRRRCA